MPIVHSTHFTKGVNMKTDLTVAVACLTFKS
jgi:hypothetical protein